MTGAQLSQLASLLRTAADIIEPPDALSVRFVLPTFRYKETGLMANPSIPFNAANVQIATVPLLWTGGSNPTPFPGGTVVSDHPEFATVSVVQGDTGVDVTPVAPGTVILTYTSSNPAIPVASATLDVVVAASTATAVSFDTANITFRLASAPLALTTS